MSAVERRNALAAMPEVWGGFLRRIFLGAASEPFFSQMAKVFWKVVKWLVEIYLGKRL